MPRSSSHSASAPDFRPGLAIILRTCSVLCGATMSVLVKFTTAAGANTGEIMFYRYSLSMPFIIFWVMTHGGMATIRTKRPVGQLSRGLIGMGSMMLTFTTLQLLPLAEATTLFFLSPLLATVLSIFMLKEHVGLHRWLAISVGIIGMVIMIHPGTNQGLSAAGVASGLTAVVFLASSVITVRQLGSTETATATVFWFTLIGTIITSIAMPFFFQWHDFKIWLLLCCCGLAGTGGQILMTSALRYAPVSTTAPIEYSQLLWATLFGWLFWSELPSLTTIIGACFIGGAGLYTFYREHLHHRRRPGIAESTTIET